MPKLPSLCAALLFATLPLAGCSHGAAGPAAQSFGSAGGSSAAEREASAYCWMQQEHGRATLPLDKREPLVEKCMQERMAAGHHS
jgi:hypothetical protein